MSKKRGILLITTLFFVVILIMMSVALFGLTRSNYSTMKDYDARQTALTNAENAIQILAFLISHSPSAFSIGVTTNLSQGSNFILNFPSLDNTNKIGKILNNFSGINQIYNFSIVNLENGQIFSVGVDDSRQERIDIEINDNQRRSGAVFVFWDRRSSDITQNGAIVFFGNYVNDGTNNYPPNVYYGSVGASGYQSSTQNNSQGSNVSVANSIIIRFSPNRLVISNHGSGFPLYSSYNNSLNHNEIRVNGRRSVRPTSLCLMAMGYSRVPSTNRYVVTYVDQHFSNKSFSTPGSLVSEGSTIIDAEKLEVGTYQSQQQNNNFYSKRFKIVLKDGNNKYTKFYISKMNQQNQYEATYDGINGKVIASEPALTNWEYSFKYEGEKFKSIQQLLSDQNYNDIKSHVGAEFSSGSIDSKFDRVRNALLNEVKSQFINNNYITLDPGYYIFVNKDTIVWFPQNLGYNEIDEILKSAVRADGTIEGSAIRSVSGRIFSSHIVQNEIYMQDYNLIIKKNVKLSSSGGFIHITSWKASYHNNGKVKDDGKSGYRFGRTDIGVNLINGSILWYDKGAIIIDGIIQSDEERGGAIIATKDPNSDTLINSTYRAPVYYKTDYDSDPSNDPVIEEYWTPYKPERNLLKTERNRDITSGIIRQGDIVARFSQIYQGTQKIAILADNNLYINPLSENFSSIQPINLLDVVMYGEIQTSPTGSTNIVYNRESYTFVFYQQALINSNQIVLRVYRDGSVIYEGMIELRLPYNVTKFMQSIQNLLGDDQEDNNSEEIRKLLLVGLYGIMNNNDQYFDLSNIDQYYNKIVEHIKESRDQLEEEKKKRGKRNQDIRNTDIKLNGMIVVGKDLRGVGGKGNTLWFSGMVLAKGNVMVKGTKEVDFFFDPTIVDMDFLQRATTLYVPQAYKIYDKLER